MGGAFVSHVEFFIHSDMFQTLTFTRPFGLPVGYPDCQRIPFGSKARLSLSPPEITPPSAPTFLLGLGLGLCGYFFSLSLFAPSCFGPRFALFVLWAIRLLFDCKDL
ncbi:hypothetical protein GQ457_01G055410 [Hibiscus cannabinus]